MDNVTGERYRLAFRIVFVEDGGSIARHLEGRGRVSRLVSEQVIFAMWAIPIAIFELDGCENCDPEDFCHNNNHLLRED